MKILSLIFLAGLSFPGYSFASERCFEFDVTASSHGLGKIDLSVNEADAAGRKLVAKITARKPKDRFTVTEFQCSVRKSKAFCTQLDGGGDFTFEESTSSLSLSYVNLLIGSTGSVRLRPKAEINEEFALFDRANGDETDNDEESGELAPIVIHGQAVPCRGS